MTGQEDFRVELRFVSGQVQRCIPLKHSGEELQEIYEDRLEYIRAHADKLGISDSLAEELQTLLSLPVVAADLESTRHPR